MKRPTAIIAEDEAPLRSALKRLLRQTWPELELCGEAASGAEALHLIQSEHPDVAFLDIRMPGLTGLEVAAAAKGHCHIVFVTAYDDYAVEAFEREAVDYLLKPVSAERLRETVSRLQARLSVPPRDLSRLVEALAEGARGPAAFLQWLRVGQGDEVQILSVDSVDYFRAEEKVTLVMTRDREWAVRLTIAELEARLDPDRFWRIHRGTIVRVAAVSRITRGFGGRQYLELAGHAQTLTVSRSHAHRFRPM